jgi:hypothetical protein
MDQEIQNTQGGCGVLRGTRRRIRQKREKTQPHFSQRTMEGDSRCDIEIYHM